MTVQACTEVVPQKLLVLLRSLRQIPHLPQFLPEIAEVAMPRLGRVPKSFVRSFDAIAGWGHKPTSLSARRLAALQQVPYLALEDGFLRSFGLGVKAVPPLSLVADYTGIYYDGTQASDLETMIERGGFDPAVLERAAVAMAWLQHERLTKYNAETAPLASGAPIRRLLVDQTAGDASVTLSGAAETAFADMVTDALDHFAAADIAVKLHPDTVAGHKQGYLRATAEKHGLRIIDTAVNGWDLLQHVDEVATLSSQFGFDAVMAGKSVHCYGLPFYAGWGLTLDKVTTPRRKRQACAAEIFAAAYLNYARYIDPFTGQATTLEETIGLLSDLTRHEKRGAVPSVAIGFSPWKKSFLRKYTGNDTVFRSRTEGAGSDRRHIIWASREEKLRGDKIPADLPVTRMEDGFIRSRGLGVHLARPWSLVLDRRGIYYDPQQESDLEHILETEDMPQGLLQRADALRRLICQKETAKYNTGAAAPPVFDAGGKTVILVPGQVEEDASIRKGTVDICTNADLLEAVRQENPTAFIVYKPHPDVEAGRRKGAVTAEVLARCADAVVRKVNIVRLWPAVDAVHTMTSLAGFEALLRGKMVKTYGKPFYAGWGLTEDRHRFQRRRRRLSIHQLVAGTLILYPAYWDWKTQQPCNAETVIRRLAKNSE